MRALALQCCSCMHLNITMHSWVSFLVGIPQLFVIWSHSSSTQTLRSSLIRTQGSHIPHVNTLLHIPFLNLLCCSSQLHILYDDVPLCYSLKLFSWNSLDKTFKELLRNILSKTWSLLAWIQFELSFIFSSAAGPLCSPLCTVAPSKSGDF